MSNFIRLKNNSPYYQAVITLKDQYGNIIEKERSTKETGKRKAKAKANEIERQLQHELDAGTQIDSIKREASFEDYARLVIEESDYNLSTKNNYLNLLEKHAFPFIGNIKIKNIRPNHIESLIIDLKKDCINRQNLLDQKKQKAFEEGVPFKIRTDERPYVTQIKKTIDVIRIILQDAKDEHIINGNAVADANQKLIKKLPKPKKHTQPYTKQEIHELVSRIVGTKLETPVVISCCLGSRRQSTLGMKFTDINFDTGIITSNSVIIKIDNVSTCCYREWAKTSESDDDCSQTYVAGKGLLEYLLRIRDEHDKMREIVGPSYDDHYIDCEDELHNIRQKHYNRDNLDFVCRDEYGKVLKPNYVSQTFNQMLDELGLRHIRFHDLRHYVGRAIIEETHDINLAKEELGHSQIGTTVDIYGQADNLDYKRKGTEVLDSTAQVANQGKEKKKNEDSDDEE